MKLETIIAYIKTLPDDLTQAITDARAGDKAATRYLRIIYKHNHPMPNDHAAEAHAERMAEYAAESAEAWTYADNNPN